MTQTPELLYPHEDLDGFLANRSPLPRVIWEQYNYIGRALPAELGILTGSGTLFDYGLRHVFEYANGPAGAELQRKDSFARIIRELGYLAPRSELILPSEDPDSVTEKILSVDTCDPLRFCKPLRASQGRGTYLGEDPEEIKEFISRKPKLLRSPYLVQEALKPEQDWRYVLHRDTSHLVDGKPPGWRIAYHKVRPTVTGDGASPIHQLVRRNEAMPNSSKLFYALRHPRNLVKVPNDGEAVELIHTGNIHQGAYSRIPETDELDYMDTFMLHFLGDLEKHFDTTFGTLCFDIGVLDAGVFEQPYNFDAMKEVIAFYEHQLPFGTSGYLSRIPVGEHNIVSEKIRRAFVREKVGSAFVSSVVQSGIVIRRDVSEDKA